MTMTTYDPEVKVYPRVCGGTITPPPTPPPLPGLSPRVRGNQPAPAEHYQCARSIPACAGEPRRGPDTIAGREVYPRVCGGT